VSAGRDAQARVDLATAWVDPRPGLWCRAIELHQRARTTVKVSDSESLTRIGTRWTRIRVP
jgi:hypothetical protein